MLVSLLVAMLSLRPSPASLRAAQARLANGIDERSEAALAPAIRASPRPLQDDVATTAPSSPDSQQRPSLGPQAQKKEAAQWDMPWFEQSPAPQSDPGNEERRSLLPRRRSAAERAADWLIRRYEDVYGEPYEPSRKRREGEQDQSNDT